MEIDSNYNPLIRFKQFSQSRLSIQEGLGFFSMIPGINKPTSYDVELDLLEHQGLLYAQGIRDEQKFHLIGLGEDVYSDKKSLQGIIFSSKVDDNRKIGLLNTTTRFDPSRGRFHSTGSYRELENALANRVIDKIREKDELDSLYHNLLYLQTHRENLGETIRGILSDSRQEKVYACDLTLSKVSLKRNANRNREGGTPHRSQGLN